jgi:hypothetical protein
MLASGKVQVAGMISEQLPLADAPLAFAKAAQRGVLEIVRHSVESGPTLRFSLSGRGGRLLIGSYSVRSVQSCN